MGVRIYNRALTANEIYRLYDETRNGGYGSIVQPRRRNGHGDGCGCGTGWNNGDGCGEGRGVDADYGVHRRGNAWGDGYGFGNAFGGGFGDGGFGL